MKHLTMIAVLTVGVSLLPMVAQAEDEMLLDGQVYIGGQLGGSFASDSEIDDGVGLSALDTEADLDTGVVFGGIVGFHFDEAPYRPELEVSYRQNGIDGLSTNIGPGTGSGDTKVTTVMLNGYYDFALPEHSQLPLTPYIGVGLGAAHIALDGSLGVPGIGTVTADDSDTVFAYQGIAGASYALNDQISLTADYRYLGTATPSFTTTAAVPFDADYSGHELRVGLRYGF